MIKVNKKLKYYYEVLYGDETYNIEREIIYKYNIKNNQIISKQDFNKILKDNEYYYFDRISKNKLKKLLTTFELEEFLIKNGANQNIINDLIEKYLSFKYLDDNYYVKTYIELKSNKEGPKLIKQKLNKKGIKTELIEKHLKMINEEEVISNLVLKLINKYNKYNKNQMATKIKQFLINKGYNYTIVNNVTDLLLENVVVNENHLIVKDFDKIYNRYKDKMDLYQLKQTIKQKLYQKGYNKNNIDKIIEEKI